MSVRHSIFPHFEDVIDRFNAIQEEAIELEEELEDLFAILHRARRHRIIMHIGRRAFPIRVGRRVRVGYRVRFVVQCRI